MEYILNGLEAYAKKTNYGYIFMTMLQDICFKNQRFT